jgi:hypothetical protein
LTGRGGAFAAGGGEAAGAGRAGGTVGIADLGVSLEDGAAPACAAEALGVAEVAGDAAGRLASVGVADAGRVASAARAVEMPAAPGPAGRAGAAPVDADPDAVADAVVVPRVALDAEPNGTAPDAEPVGAAPDAEPAATALLLGADVVARGAVPGCAGCGDVDLAAAGRLETSAAGSVAGAVGDLRTVAAAADDADAVPEAVLPVATGVEAAELLCTVDAIAAPVADPEVGAAGAADRVGGIGASPDPRSAASNIGDAHVPEYALSVDVDPPCEAVAELLELAVGAGALEPVVAESPEVGAFTAVGFACPVGAAGTAGMPNPAGDLTASVAAADFEAAAPCPRVAAPWASAPAAAGLGAPAAEALDEIGVAALAAVVEPDAPVCPAAEDCAEAAPGATPLDEPDAPVCPPAPGCPDAAP